MSTRIIICVALAFLLLTPVPSLAQTGDAITISQVEDGFLLYSNTTIVVTDPDQTSLPVGPPIVVEFRLKYPQGVLEANSTRFGFLNVSKLRNDSEDNRSVFSGSSSTTRALVSVSGSAQQVGSPVSNDGQYHRYKIYWSGSGTTFWFDKNLVGSTGTSISHSQHLGFIPANTSEGMTIDKLSVYKGNNITVRNLYPGVKVELLDQENRIKLTTTVPATSREAVFDLSNLFSSQNDGKDLSIPINAKFRFSAPNGKPMGTLQVGDVFGGDVYEVSGVSQFTLNIKERFNLISSPVLEGVTIAEIEAQCGTLTRVGKPSNKMWMWDASRQVWINPTEVGPGQGAWIYSSRACSVPVVGRAFDGIVTLRKAFNLIGSLGSFDESVGSCGTRFLAVGPKTNKQVTWGWDADLQQWYNPRNLDPRNGFWVFIQNVDSCCFKNTTCHVA